jgi:aurora kinase
MSETVSTASSHSNKGKEEQDKNCLMISDFVLGKKLGSGKFGEVFVARHKKSGFICALKKISKNNMDPKLVIQLIR